MNEGVKREIWVGRECMYVPYAPYVPYVCCSSSDPELHVCANPTLGPALAREVECGRVFMYNMYNAILRMRQS